METIVLDKCPRAETERLILRKWEQRDLDGLIELCGHPGVMKFFGAVKSPEEAEQMLGRVLRKQDQHGYCFPVVEDKQSGRLLGFCGLNVQETDIPIGPCVEIGWRLQRDAWGKGIAMEAAGIWLKFGFEILKLDEIVANAVVGNQRSENTMKRLGMIYSTGDDFIDPDMDANAPLARNFLYRITKQQFLDREYG
ncbi:GNAT family N-acetyltransferase [Pseudovibrio sp. Tun.PSC04-5.I4]|uniref:GNAT family N-acetyltransferase n=1 Tax=Pseudovibrio sp. Tun.PSC04-5.I4 TaxID=1798213 RepID=UPI0008859AE1|nr:GNAT family N-acetyltransferase [Pseudovibrio sp. Tun.PSC04-5.I4]SDR26552.1 Protein N-acetyltransferase, RimJ/RimL family [Pseudovibrio sp. Tun.PSC04-5.I4]